MGLAAAGALPQRQRLAEARLAAAARATVRAAADGVDPLRWTRLRSLPDPIYRGF